MEENDALEGSLAFSSSQSLSADEEAISRLREAVLAGEPWYLALLDAIRQWRAREEVVDGRRYQYLIANEAFDWLVLAERLGQAIADLVPSDELEKLLFHGEPPIELPVEEFRQRIGAAKYRAHLNYLYGIVVEEALILAVEQEVQKEQHCRTYREDARIFEDTYQRIYGASEATLFQRFREQANSPTSGTLSLFEWKEFTYWLFKYRLRQCHRVRVASDTRKALEELRRQWARRRAPHEPSVPVPPDAIEGECVTREA